MRYVISILLLCTIGSVHAQQAPPPKLESPSQRLEDARALVSQLWDDDGDTIKSIVVAYKCGVVDKLLAEVAARSVQMEMQDQAMNAGLAGDPTAYIDGALSENVIISSGKAGRDAVKAGACDRLAPADRAELRAMISALIPTAGAPSVAVFSGD